MASSVTTITTTKSLSTCGAVLLSGPIKVIAKDMAANDFVQIYEETATEGDYQPVPDTNNRSVVLRMSMQSFIFEGYGNYKFLLGENTNEALVVGYAA